MANPPKPWKAEYAKSSRASCKSCKNNIEKETLRLGKMVAATQFDGFMPMWNHSSCIFKKSNQIKSVDDVEGIDLLRWEDQQKIRKYVEDGLSVTTTAVAVNDGSIEVSQTSRAGCRRCNEKIMKGKVRISTKPEGQGGKGLAWYHVNCFIQISPSTLLEKLSGYDDLPIQDKEAVQALNKKKVSAAKSVSKVQIQDDREEQVQQSASKGTKRRKAMSSDQPAKIPKGEEKISSTRGSSNNNNRELGNSNSSADDLENSLKQQSKALWAIKDDLKKHVTTAELREMLEANKQDSAGSEYDLRDRWDKGCECLGVLIQKAWAREKAYRSVPGLTMTLPEPDL